jgi:hypothetical protein
MNMLTENSPKKFQAPKKSLQIDPNSKQQPIQTHDDISPISVSGAFGARSRLGNVSMDP